MRGGGTSGLCSLVFARRRGGEKGYSSQVLGQRYPPSHPRPGPRTGVRPPPLLVKTRTGYPPRTCHSQDMPQVVCLMQSRRNTFLLQIIFQTNAVSLCTTARKKRSKSNTLKELHWRCGNLSAHIKAYSLFCQKF